MIVGQFNESYPPIMDGVANVVVNYAYWIQQKYGKCYVVVPQVPNYKDESTHSVLRYPSIPIMGRTGYRIGVPKLSPSFLMKIERIPFDILHVHCPFSSGQLAKRISQRNKIPLVATFHSKYEDDFKQYVSKNMLKVIVKNIVNFYESADEVWAVNNGTAKTLWNYGFQREIHIMNNGTDFPITYGKESDKVQLCSSYDLEPDKPMLLFVGQHIWQKNLRFLIDGLRLLKEFGMEFNMLFVGNGYAKEEMFSLVSDYGLSESTRFAGKITDREKLRKIFAASDLFLFPSVYDNAPIVVREAAACGCPSVLLKNTNAAEGITDGFNGFTTNEDELAFAKKIATVLKNRELLKKVGEEARKTVYLPWEDIVDDVVKDYKRIIYEYNDRVKQIN